MADELGNPNLLENQTKHEIADSFLNNNCENLNKLGAMFIEQEKVNGNEQPGILFCFFQIYKGLLLINDQRLTYTLLSSRFFL